MDIEPKSISIRELVAGYQDKNEDGVIGFGGKLNIRPPYQREFVYDEKQRESVIDTVTRGFPLNTMYWAVTTEGFEIIDGQQRTISIAQYVDSVFSYKTRYFHNLQEDEREAILNYKLTVYHCQGTPSEKLDWFRTINISGAKLEPQELRNAVFAGSWTADAKRYFSKSTCAAWKIGNKYLNGSPIRQDYLETAISWINGGDIDGYMATHQDDDNANPIWLYFQSVINWVNATFTHYRKEMQGIQWGVLYNDFKDKELDPKKLEARIAALMEDEDVTNKKGIYVYVLDGKEKNLNIRAFTNNQKREAFEGQKGVCPVCKKGFAIEEMEGDHITPWHEGGKTSAENCQMLCKEDNRRKSGK
jgi:hypothetical protein